MDTYIGFDTSCYTTSVAMVDGAGRLILDQRTALEVKRGGRGLRQSEGVFQHIKNLGTIEGPRGSLLNGCKIAAAAASVRPRPLQDSYMPVFTVGENAARVAAMVAGIPFFETTHQENHIMAGLWSAGGRKPIGFDGTPFRRDNRTAGYRKGRRRVWGKDNRSTGDISAGQLVDRVGVAMGLPFPCGPHLEKLANGAEEEDCMVEIRWFAKAPTPAFQGLKPRQGSFWMKVKTGKG